VRDKEGKKSVEVCRTEGGVYGRRYGGKREGREDSDERRWWEESD